MRRLAVPAALGAVVAVHVGLMLYFAPPGVVLGDGPIVGADFETHYEQALRAVDSYRVSGRMWGYDPRLLAGMPSGTIFDADNKLVEVVVVAADAAGVPPHRAFNLLVWVLHLLAPLALYGSARLFGLGRPAATVAAFLGSLVWYFDALNHCFFLIGMFAWASAAYLWLLPLGLFYRWTRTREPWRLFLVMILLAVVLMLHPYVFFPLAVPMAYLYVRASKSLGRSEHAAVLAVAAGVIALNWWWLRAALDHWHYVLFSGYYMDASPDHILYDYLGLLKEPEISGVIAVRSSFRFLAFGAAVFGFLAWRRDRDDRYAPLLAVTGVLLFVAYFGAWVPPLRQIQPYRFVLPAVYLAVIPASEWIAGAVRSLRASPPRGVTAALLIVLTVVAAPRFVRDVLYFVPDLVPRHTRPLREPTPDINGPLEFGTIRWPEPFVFRHAPMPWYERTAVETIRRLDDGRGRWLVEWWMLGERMAWATDAQVIGGFRMINVAHSDANWFRRHPRSESPDPDELRRYFETYNVRWVVLSGPVLPIESRSDLLEPAVMIFGARIYRCRVPSSWIADDPGADVRAEMDRIVVRGSKGGDLVLRYHWHEDLVCRPGCEIYRAPIPGDRVGFIGVRHAPPDFEIVNPR